MEPIKQPKSPVSLWEETFLGKYVMETYGKSGIPVLANRPKASVSASNQSNRDTRKRRPYRGEEIRFREDYDELKKRSPFTYLLYYTRAGWHELEYKKKLKVDQDDDAAVCDLEGLFGSEG